MRYFMALLLLLLLQLPLLAAVDITDLPEGANLDAEYDLSWTLTLSGVPKGPLQLALEATDQTPGLRVSLESTRATLVWAADTPQVRGVAGVMALAVGRAYTCTIKRRADAVALLLDHRFICALPMASPPAGTVAFVWAPGEMQVTDARYRKVAPCNFGDDFMRPEALASYALSLQHWVDDDIWKVAYYRKDNPGDSPRDPATKAAMLNPWVLSLFPILGNTSVYKTSTNGFWMDYNGVGPSWVVSNPLQVYPFADRYFVDAAVKPEYDSTVGLMAAYQDNKNYLLFRWKQEDAGAANAPHAALVAMIDGKEQVLASTVRGFHPGQWYALRLHVDWHTVEVLVDNTLLMTAANPGPVEGRVGLYADGAPAPRRPRIDDATATMYVMKDQKTGKVTNDAAEALRTTSVVYFDDVRVGPWTHAEDLLANSDSFHLRSGTWNTAANGLQAATPGLLLTVPDNWSRYESTVRVQLPAKGCAGMLFDADGAGDGYGWLLTEHEQYLCTVIQGVWQRPLLSVPFEIKAGDAASLRLAADGAYVAMYCNDQLVLDNFDPRHTAGRVGVVAQTAGVFFRDFALTQTTYAKPKFIVHDGFATDRWIATWASQEAEWYPAVIPATDLTPLRASHTLAGKAAPFPTNIPGVYWHKAGHFHDVQIIIPVTCAALAGQIVHLTTKYDNTKGYQFQLAAAQPVAGKTGEQQGAVKLMRDGVQVGEYPYPVTDHTRLRIERRGTLLLMTAERIDPASAPELPVVLEKTPVFAYRDPQPLHAEMVGFTVTSAALAAAVVQVESDRIRETFERSPVGWATESGVWLVMNRFSCQPQWNWFGGFGAHTPTVWSKYRLDGDQTAEAYMGVKMQYIDMAEEYARRYRDLNVTICADGAHLNSGYSLIRSGRLGGQPATFLLRKGVKVWSSTAPEHLLPPRTSGHRQWFATRLEKRGAELRVYLDNRLATTYIDPDPLPGGYFACWTLDNGMMIGRINLSADKITLGAPQMSTPLVVQPPLDPLPAPKIADAPLVAATFEQGNDGWTERPGLTGRLLRERVVDKQQKLNTYLTVVNTYPAGDCSVTTDAVKRDITAKTRYQFDYCFDPGAKVNLYLRAGKTTYEILLTGAHSTDDGIVAAGQLPAVADGAWHTLKIDLGTLLLAAAKPAAATLSIDEFDFAEWTTPPDLRHYGFGLNPGGSAIRFDNVSLVNVP